MTFQDYYASVFRGELIEVIRTLPAHHEHSSGAIAIQPRTLSDQNASIAAMNEQQRTVFASALFFTVLVDQVCYTYFRGSYEPFQALTRYPKWIGDCPGGCSHNLHPSSILRAIGSPAGPAYNWNGRVSLLPDAIPVMKGEVLDFFSTHLQEVDSTAFWSTCSAHLPREFRRVGYAGTA